MRVGWRQGLLWLDTRWKRDTVVPSSSSYRLRARELVRRPFKSGASRFSASLESGWLSGFRLARVALYFLLPGMGTDNAVAKNALDYRLCQARANMNDLRALQASASARSGNRNSRRIETSGQ